MGPMGIPWEWEAQTEFMGMGMGMVDKKWEGNGNSSLEEIPISRVNHIFGIIFFKLVGWLAEQFAISS